MTDEAEAAREYERLRGELAEFVLGILSERIAAGNEPELSQALIDAIDRRVEAAIGERLKTERPIEPRGNRAATNPRRKGNGKLLVYGIIAAVAVAVIAFLLLRFLVPPVTNTTVPTVPDSGEPVIMQVENGQTVPLGNAIAPEPSNAATPR